MDNPLDTAGEVVKGAGEVASQGLFGFARFLEQITGDAVSAAIFAGFLIFALTLVKGAGLSRNASLYSQAIMRIGIIGMVGYAAFCLIQTLGSADDVSEIDLVVQGLTGEKPSQSNIFAKNLENVFSLHKWYFFVFIVMTIVGFLLYRSPIGNQKNS